MATRGTLSCDGEPYHPKRSEVTGSVCGVKAQEVEDPLMREIRILDKLVDDLGKGKALEAVLRR